PRHRTFTRPSVLCRDGSLHVHFHAHPGMDAALEEMLALRETRDVDAATLSDSRPGHRDVGEAAGALRNGGLAMVEGLHESATELRPLRERVGLTALIDHGQVRPLVDRQLVGLEVPTRIGGSLVCLVDEITQRGRETKRTKRDLVAEASP